MRQQHSVQSDNNRQPAHQPQQYYPNQHVSDNKKWWWPTLESKILVALLTGAAIIVLLALAYGAFGRSQNPVANLVDKDGWQAVFLSNGQVYFGKITTINDRMLVLEDIYYLQVDQQIQPGQEEDEDNQEPQVSLAKLGGELHGPQDQMFISVNEVVFWENLKDRSESQVVEAIHEYKSGNGQQQPQPEAQEGEGGGNPLAP